MPKGEVMYQWKKKHNMKQKGPFWYSFITKNADQTRSLLYIPSLPIFRNPKLTYTRNPLLSRLIPIFIRRGLFMYTYGTVPTTVRGQNPLNLFRLRIPIQIRRKKGEIYFFFFPFFWPGYGGFVTPQFLPWEPFFYTYLVTYPTKHTIILTNQLSIILLLLIEWMLFLKGLWKNQ